MKETIELTEIKKNDANQTYYLSDGWHTAKFVWATKDGVGKVRYFLDDQHTRPIDGTFSGLAKVLYDDEKFRMYKFVNGTVFENGVFKKGGVYKYNLVDDRIIESQEVCRARDAKEQKLCDIFPSRYGYKLKFFNGDILEGVFENEKLQKGKITFANGDVHEGIFEDGVLKDGIKYKLNEVETNENKNNSIPNSVIMYDYLNTSIFNGVVELYHDKEKTFDAEYKNGRLNKVILTDGDICSVYVGQFENSGILVDGKIYTGKFVDGKFDGEVEVCHSNIMYGNNKLYDLEYENGVVTKKILPNGDIHEGNFDTNDNLNGYGIIYEKNANVLYEGDFTHGKRSGKGTYSLGSGYEIDCNYTDDECVGIVYKYNEDEKRVKKGEVKINSHDSIKGIYCFDDGTFYINSNGNKKLYDGLKNGWLYYTSGNKQYGEFDEKGNPIDKTNVMIYYSDHKTLFYNGEGIGRVDDFNNFKLVGDGTLYNNQGYIDGKLNDSKLTSGTFYSNKEHGEKPLYTLTTDEDSKTKTIQYFLNGQKDIKEKPNLTLFIDQNNILHWQDDITERMKSESKNIFNSFGEEESWNYDCILANLALINANNNIVQFNNNTSFTYIRDNNISVQDQLNNFLNFAKKPENKGKVVTSELYTKNHAIGII